MIFLISGSVFCYFGVTSELKHPAKNQLKIYIIISGFDVLSLLYIIFSIKRI